VKFSILIPTRGRIEYLRQAVETIRRQDYGDWELVISDNVSEDGTAEYVLGLDDPRVRYHRQERFVPVTDNWNTALELSNGDYVWLLGDNDGLLPGALRTAADVIERFDHPDLLFTGALLFMYPRVAPGFPDGYFFMGHWDLLRSGREPFRLPPEEARGLVDAAMDLKYAFPFEMQRSIPSRGLVERLRADGPVFRPPFPDFYASTSALLHAESVVVVPRPLPLESHTRGSVGEFSERGQETSTAAFLGNEAYHREAEERGLPGSFMDKCFVLAMEEVARAHPSAGLRVNHSRFRVQQLVLALFDRYRKKSLSREELREIAGSVPPLRRAAVTALAAILFLATRPLPRRMRQAIFDQVHLKLVGFRPKPPDVVNRDYGSLLDVFENWPALEPLLSSPTRSAAAPSRQAA
jgi:glycosyltransferase involved in cell wall biosynthesis